MRKDSLIGLALVGLLVLPGCAPKFNSLMPTAQPAAPAAAMMSGGNRDSLGNPQKSMWSKISAPVTNSVKRGSDKIGSLAKMPIKKVSDPTKLSTKVPPAKPAMHVSMAKMLEASGDVDGAIGHYTQALAIAPKDYDALMGYGHLLDNQGRLAEAAEKYQQACQQHPNQAPSQNDLGLCYARSQRLQEALVPLQRAVELQPERALYRNNIAAVYAELGRHNDALQHFRAAHGPSVAHYNLGYLLHKRGKHQAAAEQFSRAIAIDPSFAPARQLADSLAQRGYRGSATANVGRTISAQSAPNGGRYESYYQRPE